MILGPWYHVGDTDEHPNLVAICDVCMASAFGLERPGWDTEEQMIAEAGAQGWIFASTDAGDHVVACPAHTVEEALLDYGAVYASTSSAPDRSES